jgi:hypothetical protein
MAKVVGDLQKAKRAKEKERKKDDRAGELGHYIYTRLKGPCTT